MKFLPLIVPAIFLLTFAAAIFRKVKIYETFSDGIKDAIPLVLSVFPYIAAITMMVKVFDASGLSGRLTNFLSPVFERVGVPGELVRLILIKPLSGNGAVTALSDVLDLYGTDSYIGYCACTIYGCSETVFYVGTVYFSGLADRKKLAPAFIVAILSYLLAVCLACYLCRFTNFCP